MIFVIALIIIVIGLTVRWYIDRRPARDQKPEVSAELPFEPRYAVGTMTMIFWQEPNGEQAANTSLLDALATLKLSSESTISGEGKGGIVARAGGSWFFTLLTSNSLAGDGICMQVSRETNRPVIAIMDYDQDCWGYALFEDGEIRSLFWNIPAYVDLDPAECKGDAKLLAETFHADPAQLQPYLRHIDPEKEYNQKAFPEDEFPLGNTWVCVDFLRRLGIQYPG
ncbi:MAG: hypothetical protein ACYC6A_16220 [Armatimonadota bacterium]